MSEPLVILGASTRAAAQSAIRAGFRPWCVDLYANRDLRGIAHVEQCPTDRYPMGLLDALAEAPPEAKVLITAALENEPRFLEALAFDHAMLGSPVQAIRQVRDPKVLASLPKQRGLRAAAVKHFSGPMHRLRQLSIGALTRELFLIKPRASAGGRGIHWWSADTPIPADHYIQQYIRGQSLSAVYRSDGWSAQMLGVTEQLVGESAFGADGFRYCGSIGPMPLSDAARKALSQLGVVLSQRYDLRGLFGVDVVMDWRGRLWPVEINPRYPDSTEIVEQMTGLHALQSMRAERGQRKRDTRQRSHSHGKAVLFARTETTIPDLYAILPEHTVADVPAVGERRDAGSPIATVFASAATRQACEQTLHERAAAVYDALKTNR